MKFRPLCLVLASSAVCFGQITLNPSPTRVIGQDATTVKSFTPNLVEGREFFNPSAIALDTSTSPPALYVSDTGNNRVLGWRSSTSFTNGQTADIVIGQPDLATTFAEVPGRTTLGVSLTTGLASPIGLAVDARGSVYVVDAANNRILRFPQPFQQSGIILPDLVIGQTSFAGSSPNQGGSAPTPSTLSFLLTPASGNPSVLSAFITFDSSGNLWVSDAGNNRVLRFNASVLGSQPTQGPSADTVLGQSDFQSNGYNPPAAANPLTLTGIFEQPTGIAFDSSGNLFVEESVSTRRGRILVWTPPFFSGQPASKLLGVDLSNPQPPVVNPYQLSASPGGIFAVGNSIGVADTFNSRILVFPPVSQWTFGQTYQAAAEVAGQPDLNSGQANQGMATPTASTLAAPSDAVYLSATSQLFVSDAGNNRVLVMPQNGNSFGPATAVLGQNLFTLNSINYTEGREVDFTTEPFGGTDAGVAVDLSSNPPHIYIADTYNNRILGYKNLQSIQSGQKADIVIGQPDFQQTLINYPSNKANSPNASGLFAPTGMAVDSAGNLYVADTGNGRVLRFPAPFASYNPGTPESADLVLGQPNFTTVIQEATQRTMAAPYGIALTLFPGILVSDASLNRVLFFPGTHDQLTSGMSASIVFGQPDFTSSSSGSGPAQLSAPHHIAADSSDRLYVADSGNGRVQIWDHAPTASIGEPAAQPLTSGLSQPRGMYVGLVTGDIWVSDPGTNSAVRFPPYDLLEQNGFKPNATIPDAFLPVAATEDAYGDLYLADALANRVSVYYPGMAPENAADYLFPNVMAPGMITALFTTGTAMQFGGQPSQAGSLPLPTQLNGIEVLFNGSAVPLIYADPGQINFIVPNGAPQSGTADLQVVNVATGQTLGDTTVVMIPSLPGLFSQTGNGVGTVAALNQDNTPNSPTNEAIQGSTIQIFATGLGAIPGAPPDGSPAPMGGLQSPTQPTVIMGPNIIYPGPSIPYAGLAPGYAGLWQINVVIPNDVITVAPGPGIPASPVYVEIEMNSVFSGTPTENRGVQIYVKQKP